jgi:hypothetical protein
MTAGFSGSMRTGRGSGFIAISASGRFGNFRTAVMLRKAVLSLRAKINSGVRSPETVADLITHYKQHELTLDRKAFATVDPHTVYIKNYVTPSGELASRPK